MKLAHIIQMSEDEEYAIEAEIQRLADNTWNSKKVLEEACEKMAYAGMSSVTQIEMLLEPIAEFSDFTMISCSAATELAMQVVNCYGCDYSDTPFVLNCAQELIEHYPVSPEDLLEGAIIASNVATRERQPLPVILEKLASDARSSGLSAVEIARLYAEDIE